MLNIKKIIKINIALGVVEMINKRRSFITGIKGTVKPKEVVFLKNMLWGISFSRNIISIQQTKN